MDQVISFDDAPDSLNDLINKIYGGLSKKKERSTFLKNIARRINKTDDLTVVVAKFFVLLQEDKKLKGCAQHFKKPLKQTSPDQWGKKAINDTFDYYINGMTFMISSFLNGNRNYPTKDVENDKKRVQKFTDASRFVFYHTACDKLLKSFS